MSDKPLTLKQVFQIMQRAKDLKLDSVEFRGLRLTNSQHVELGALVLSPDESAAVDEVRRRREDEITYRSS